MTAKMRKTERQSKFWCFTWYDDEPLHLNPPKFDPKTMTYLVYQSEICPETKREHIQGYVEFKVNTRLKKAQSDLDHLTLHMEVRKGSAEQARDYCMKPESSVEGSQREYGVISKGQGHRTDIETVATAIRDGMTPKDVAMAHPGMFMKYGRGIRDLYMTTRQGYTGKRYSSMIWGPSNAGKSQIVNSIFGNIAYLHKGQGHWFDGYNGQEVIIFDDFDFKAHPRTFLLNLFDRGEMLLPVKGGHVMCQAKILILTTAARPIYFLDDVEMGRRVECIEFMSAQPVANWNKVQHFNDLNTASDVDALIDRWNREHPGTGFTSKPSSWRKVAGDTNANWNIPADMEYLPDYHEEHEPHDPATLAAMDEYLDHEPIE